MISEIEVFPVEPGELIWQGRIGNTPLRVGVSHAERIMAEWDSPTGPRHKISSSVPEFERSVLFQLLLNAGETDDSSTKEVVQAIEQAQAQRPAPPSAPKRRKNAKAKFHRRSRRAPRRR